MIFDVLYSSLGVEGSDTGMIPVIRRTDFPVRKTKLFTTSMDNQTSVMIRILEGDRSMADDNTKLGCFELGSIEPRPWGMARISITFDVDDWKVLVVSAKDLDCGREQCFTHNLYDHKGCSRTYGDLTDKTEAYMVNERERTPGFIYEGLTENFLYYTEKVIHETGHRFDPEKIKTIKLLMNELQELIQRKYNLPCL